MFSGSLKRAVYLNVSNVCSRSPLQGETMEIMHFLELFPINESRNT